MVQVRCKQFPVNASFEIRPEKLITVQTVTSTCCHDMTGFTTVCDSDPMFGRDIKDCIVCSKLSVGGQNR